MVRLPSCGRSVATAGDVNGDGFSDVIVGACAGDNGQADEGQAFVYHGTQTGLSHDAVVDRREQPSVCVLRLLGGDSGRRQRRRIRRRDRRRIRRTTTPWRTKGAPSCITDRRRDSRLAPSWTSEGNQTGAFYGWSVNTAGDVDGDGYCDVIVGALTYDNGEANEGRAFVYGGSPVGLGSHSRGGRRESQSGVCRVRAFRRACRRRERRRICRRDHRLGSPTTRGRPTRVGRSSITGPRRASSLRPRGQARVIRAAPSSAHPWRRQETSTATATPTSSSARTVRQRTDRRRARVRLSRHCVEPRRFQPRGRADGQQAGAQFRQLPWRARET